ncbi:hypothetical protein BJV78DRAFT_615971 [Lactifluus subvellereus]|nr:hypothetical protein BJV78DRAFT_615971 [Lactifluus subvellereus]
MAPHIVGNERGVSPVLPNRASIVSVDSILPDARDSSLSTTEAKTKAIADIVAEGNATAEKEKQETDARATQARVEASVVEEREVEEEKVAKQRAADKVARAARAPSAEEQVAKQRAADKAAREAARLSSANAVATGSSWFLSKISQAAAEMAAALPPKDESSASSKSTTLHGSDASAKPPGKENQEAPRAFEYQARTSIVP